MVGVKKTRQAFGGFAGFSLVELLLVIAILSVLSAMAIMAFNSVAFSAHIQSAGDEVADLLIQARQMAITRNQLVEVQLAGNEGVFQIYERNGSNATAVGRRVRLPDGVAVCSNLSPLLRDASASTNVSGIFVVRFQPNGEPLLSPQLAASPSQIFLTIGLSRDALATNAPSNYIAVGINPYTGQVKTYRP